MANPPLPTTLSPPDGIRRDGATWRFNGEKRRRSPLEVQNVLTNLGYLVEKHTGRTDGEGGSRCRGKQEEAAALDLDAKKMKMLNEAELLKVRNGADLTAVMYLISHRSYSNAVEVADEKMRKFIEQEVGKTACAAVDFFLADPDYDSDAALAVDADPDLQPPSSDSDETRRQRRRRRRRDQVFVYREDEEELKDNSDYPSEPSSSDSTGGSNGSGSSSGGGVADGEEELTVYDLYI